MATGKDLRDYLVAKYPVYEDVFICNDVMAAADGDLEKAKAACDAQIAVYGGDTNAMERSKDNFTAAVVGYLLYGGPLLQRLPGIFVVTDPVEAVKWALQGYYPVYDGDPAHTRTKSFTDPSEMQRRAAFYAALTHFGGDLAAFFPNYAEPGTAPPYALAFQKKCALLDPDLLLALVYTGVIKPPDSGTFIPYTPFPVERYYGKSLRDYLVEQSTLQIQGR